MTEKPLPYSPPAHLVESAEKALGEAGAEELKLAADLYAAYCAVTEGRSAVTGALLPPFSACPVLVRAAWLAAARV